MRVLLDHNLDRGFKKSLPKHMVKTAFEMGGQTISNGKLLALASEEFDVFLTCDANLKHQQRVNECKIGIVVIRALNNRLVTHSQMSDEINDAITKVVTGQVIEVLHPLLKSRFSKE